MNYTSISLIPLQHDRLHPAMENHFVRFMLEGGWGVSGVKGRSDIILFEKVLPRGKVKCFKVVKNEPLCAVGQSRYALLLNMYAKHGVGFLLQLEEAYKNIKNIKDVVKK